MIRKQVYLTRDMNRRLNDLSKAKGVPQSELIREGLEQYLALTEDTGKLWDELLEDMKQSELRDLKWNRDELYQNRGEVNHESSD